jgi:hypothetical protein
VSGQERGFGVHGHGVREGARTEICAANALVFDHWPVFICNIVMNERAHHRTAAKISADQKVLPPGWDAALSGKGERCDVREPSGWALGCVGWLALLSLIAMSSTRAGWASTSGSAPTFSS